MRSDICNHACGWVGYVHRGMRKGQIYASMHVDGLDMCMEACLRVGYVHGGHLDVCVCLWMKILT